VRSLSTAAATAAGSPDGTIRPETPSSTSSGIPPTAVVTTGTPAASASTSATGSASESPLGAT
jgi:hypothetical protein